MLGFAEFYFNTYSSAASAFSQCKSRIIQSGNPKNSNNRFHIKGDNEGYRIVFDGGFGAGDDQLIEACHEICRRFQAH
ncbi:hypothetical protein [Pseudobacteriovorax antillogorgiicola]|uniref:Uncharacterized protein n=1 Tax=Pseudobacteriovorax antillogorgiicola TaxID=1513793 RepID=A0A1Y6BQP8_9BACT|nr:hypothetical protein [Pseudobacteriovorax antillogorgiicola]TCS53789.1 hypothetical protein EDD56_10798 [Pseudobacteriovorax antillogorgiicola]SMF22229.1 hypothetical protein SAMN06296036_107174 [Pseudobacteriovorax antillogorgiicola]